MALATAPASHSQPPATASSRAEKSTTVRPNITGPKSARRPRRAKGPHAVLFGALRLVGHASPDLAATLAQPLFRTPRRHPRPAEEHDLLATARRILVPYRDAALAAWEWGDTGPRIFLVHGWEGRGAQLGAWIEPLVGLGFRVVTADLRAHGDSPGDQTTFFDHAECITACADALGPFHAVIAHSMGGAATAWAIRHRGIAKRYAMIAPPADLRDFVRGFTRMLELGEPVRESLERRIEREFGVKLEEACADHVARHQTAPLLVVHDIDDREVPFEKGRRIAEAWPGATLLRTDGLGHQRILRDPEVVRAVVRFVAAS
jgi:pimeloyl-ACP methyl ester carboxylesterase